MAYDGTEEQEKEFADIKDSFVKLISHQRIVKATSVGEYDEQNQRVKLTKIEGKFDYFGFEDKHGKYLKGYEALYLMEMVCILSIHLFIEFSKKDLIL